MKACGWVGQEGDRYVHPGCLFVLFWFHLVKSCHLTFYSSFPVSVGTN